MRLALAEDVGPGDVTAALMPGGHSASGTVTVKEPAVLAGCAWFDEVFRQLDRAVAVAWRFADGAALSAGDTVCTLDGPARPILTGERTALNFLQTLSGTATAARRFVDAVAGTGCVVLDTRKTLPGLRMGQKYAVRLGGAANHRIGLFDAILIKENHIAAMGSLEAAVAAARSAAEGILVEVEVETMAEVERALASGADRLLLDDFPLDAMRAAVALRDRVHPRRALEASGGISLENVRAIAETGVDYVSIGAMTKSVKAVDFSLRIV